MPSSVSASAKQQTAEAELRATLQTLSAQTTAQAAAQASAEAAATRAAADQNAAAQAAVGATLVALEQQATAQAAALATARAAQAENAQAAAAQTSAARASAAAAATASAQILFGRDSTATPATIVEPTVETLNPEECGAFLSMLDEAGGFAKLWRQDAALRLGLGCPQAQVEYGQINSLRLFERGRMIYWGNQKTIYVFYDESMRWEQFGDSWREGEALIEVPPDAQGREPPDRGFGKIWRNNGQISTQLGYPIALEQGPWSAARQRFKDGWMIWLNFGHRCQSRPRSRRNSSTWLMPNDHAGASIGVCLSAPTSPLTPTLPTPDADQAALLRPS